MSTSMDSSAPDIATLGTVSIVEGKSRTLCFNIRKKVFIEEQGVPAGVELDGKDDTAIHVLAKDTQQQPCGAARLLIEDGSVDDRERVREMVGKIGRVSVLREHRGKGFGRSIIRFSVDHLRLLGCVKAKLGAQTHAIPFYENLGFVVSEKCAEYTAAGGVPHRDMEKLL